MLGEQSPDELPVRVEQEVAEIFRHLASVLGPIRIEWADDGERLWILQLNQLSSSVQEERTSVVAWLDFDPLSGLDVLRSLIAEASGSGAGIRVVRPVGLTSHVGDLLRQAGIATRFTAI
jgi:hypothetical protein